MSRKTLGELEKLMILAVLHPGRDAYGETIIQELEGRAVRTVSAGTVYVAMRRSKKEALVTSRL